MTRLQCVSVEEKGESGTDRQDTWLTYQAYYTAPAKEQGVRV